MKFCVSFLFKYNVNLLNQQHFHLRVHKKVVKIKECQVCQPVANQHIKQLICQSHLGLDYMLNKQIWIIIFC